jgi:hypothetical protein
MIEDHQGPDLELRPADTDFINSIDLSRQYRLVSSLQWFAASHALVCKTDNLATAIISSYNLKICYPCGIFLADCQISMGVATC